MADFDKIFADLRTEIQGLEQRYLAHLIPAQPEHTPDVFEHDVKSFCVMAHANFEEFIEVVSDEILMEVSRDVISKKLSLASVSLLMIYSDRISISDDEAVQGFSCFDILRKAMDDCKKKHSKAIMDNHGFSPKYMRRMLQPVGLNLPTDEFKLASARKLADARGSYAHSRSKHAMYGEYKKAKTPLTPEEAASIAGDCLGICESIKDAAKSRW